MLFAAAVVVYNKSCADSPTCQALKNIGDATASVLIYDNSTADYGNRAYCEENGWVYLGGNGNLGISKAYNTCVDYLSEQTFDGYICLFDDDTHLDPSYFSQLQQACDGAKENIFVPLIIASGKLISPCILNPTHRVNMFQNTQDALSYDGDSLGAINSCMALHMKLFANLRYDENIFLDGVDHNFVLQMRQKGEKIKVFPYRCEHAFSGVEKPPVKSALVRFRIYATDYRYILRNHKCSYLRLVGKRAVKLTLQYKSLVFLKTLLRTLSSRQDRR